METAHETFFKFDYETTTCGRCGGSGRYSYNLMHGNVCYGCSGSGKAYTKAGAAARKAVANVTRPLSIPAFDLVVGDEVKLDGFDGQDNPRFWTLVSVEMLPETSGYCETDGVRTYTHHRRLVFRLDGVERVVSGSVLIIVSRRRTQAERFARAAAVRGMPGVKVTETTRPAK